MRSSFLIVLVCIAFNACTAAIMPFGNGLNLNEEPSSPNVNGNTPFQPEISRIICACNEKKTEKCVNTPTLPTTTTTTGKPTISIDVTTMEELKEITSKLETLLHQRVFNHIVKRSIGHDSETQMNKMFESMKTMFDLDGNEDFKEFKSKLMAMPEDRKMPLSELVKTLKSHFAIEETTTSNDNSECEQKSRIECGAGQKLKIIRGVITNKNKNTCPSKTSMAPTVDFKTTCTEEEMTTKTLNEKCNDQQSCELSVDTDFESMCECAENKYLNMTYTCVEETSSRIKRALHYRNRPNQMKRDKQLRGFGGYGLGGYGLGAYGGFGGYGLGAYGGFGGYGLGLYGGYGLPYDYYGYGLGLGYDYYGYGYGIPIVYDY